MQPQLARPLFKHAFTRMQRIPLLLIVLGALIKPIALDAESVAPCIASAVTSIEFVAGIFESVRTRIQIAATEHAIAPLRMQFATYQIASPTDHIEPATYHIKRPIDRVAPARIAMKPVTVYAEDANHHANSGELVVTSAHSRILRTPTRMHRVVDQADLALDDIKSAAPCAKARILRNTLELNHMRLSSTVVAAPLLRVARFAALRTPANTRMSRGLITAATAVNKVAAGLNEVAAACTDASVGASLPTGATPRP